MRILGILLTGLLALDAYAVITSPISNQFDNTGSLVRKDQIYIKVKNNSGASVSSGAVFVWDASADDGATVTTTTLTGAKAACVAAETIADESVGLCQIYGYHSGIQFTGGTTAANQAATAGRNIFIAGDDAGKVKGLGTAEIAGVLPNSVGVFLDGATASTSLEAFIDVN